MHIESIILDGFKSYSTRTVIGPLDIHFNAVTGLNGSGKSNVLDSLCFALGIADLTCVRANKLDDLIYKQGQAGITKATVTIVLNNRNKTTTLPDAYQKLPQITITRQIAIGGRNRYFINSHPSTPKAIADFFQAAGMNVNNPRFLIMQGRVTKVVNMKPKELLALIEEASGTSIYENKRAAAVRLMARKEQKLEEIRKLLSEEIEPAMQKLKNDRDDYVNWSNAKEEAERLERFDVAYKYWLAKSKASSITQRECMLISEKAAMQHDLDAMEDELGQLDKKLEELRKSLEIGNQPLVQAQNEKNNITKTISKLESDLKILQRDLEEADTSAKGIKSDMDAAQKKLEARQKSSYNESEAIAKFQKQLEEDKKLIAQLEASLGIGTGSSDTGSSRQAQLKQLKTQLSKNEADEYALQSKIKHDEADMKNQREVLKKMGSEVEKFQKLLQTAEKNRQDLQTQHDKSAAELDKLGGEEKVANLKEGLKEAVSNYQKLYGTAQALQAELDRCRTRCNVPPNVPRANGRGIEAPYYGQVFDILSLKPEMAACSLAVHVLFGARLSYLVARDKECAKAIFEANGYARSNRKVTVLPLQDAVVGRVISKDDVIHCRKVALVEKNAVDSVASYLDVLNFDPQFAKLAQYVAGNALICSSSEIARKICYQQDKSKAYPTATLQGDKFDVGGSMSGGSNRGVYMILQTAMRLRETGVKVKEAQQAQETIRRELDTLNQVASRKSELQSKLELVNNEIKNIKSRMESCGSGCALKKLEQLDEALKTNQVALKKLQTKSAELSAQVKSLEDEIKDWETNRAKKEAESKEKIKQLKASTRRDAAKLDQMQSAIAATQIEEENLERQIASLREELQQRQDQITQVEEKMKGTSENIKEHNVKLRQVEKKLDALALQASSSKSEVAQLTKRVEDIKETKNKQAIKLRELEHELQQMTKDSHGSNAEMKRLQAQNPWIATEESNFNVKGSFFDFSSGSKLDTLTKRLQELQQLKNDLGRRVNRKAQLLYEKTEADYKDLLQKKQKVEDDRSKIQDTIAELDIKKMENINEVFTKVTRYFSDIFHILLSNAQSQLEPVNGDIKNGIEMKVGFNGTWKNSLVELSGGQRSLLALSLVLAMLKVRPAPIYILDEVDAALDLSHTQNIGKMIRTQFPNSQFIIVSLKEGMFNNANVLFRTRFVDGASTITRHAQANKINL